MTFLTPREIAVVAVTAGSLMISPFNAVYAQTLNDAITSGKFSGQFRMRYEGVDQNNVLQDADALTLRSTLKYESGVLNGFSAVLEMEDVREMFGGNQYTVGPTGFNPGIYSVVADPDTTELNQGFLQYASDGFTARLGRQVITHDSHRHIGSVPWRQDWQVFDAFTLMYDVNEDIKISYNYLDSRERIFAEEADLDTSDHLFRGAWESPLGTVAAYAYLLEVDNTPVSNALDTYGIRLSGNSKLGELPFSYLAEFATQESENGATSYDADYLMLEGGLSFSGVTAKLGYELLGSDSGAYGFATPLATLHAFNGWADLFLATPGQGLQDMYLNLSGKVLGGTLTAIFHDYEADDDTPTVSDLGSEFNIQYVRPFASRYTLGLKYADYSVGDIAAKPDTQKVWVWLQARF